MLAAQATRACLKCWFTALSKSRVFVQPSDLMSSLLTQVNLENLVVAISAEATHAKELHSFLLFDFNRNLIKLSRA